MSKKAKSTPAPAAWEGFAADPVFWLDLGAQMVIDGHQLDLKGRDVPPLWSWFDRGKPAPADRVARLICSGPRCGTPVAAVWRVWQSGAETVALIDYQARRRTDRRDQVTMHRAVLHVPTDRDECRHGSLLLHPDDRLDLYCRQHRPHVGGALVADVIRRQLGGWADSGPDEPPRPRRVVLH